MKFMRELIHHKRVIEYFEKSKLGYDFILWGSKHFGYYPSCKKDISERKAQQLMQELIAKSLKIKKDEIILDAGCGEGVVSTYLSKKHKCRIIGVTIVPFEIEKAKKLANRLGVEKTVDFKLMDYSNTVFDNNKFDALFTIESFVHSPNSMKTLREFFRILKPSGRIAMFEYNIAKEKMFTNWEKKMMDIVMEGSGMGSLKELRFGVLTDMLRKVGFKSINERNITQHLKPSFERLHKMSIVPYFFVKLFGLQKKFINVTAGYEFYKIASKGLIHYSIITAKKPNVW